MKTKKRKCLIVGYGLSAAVLAREAIKKGYAVDIFPNGDLEGGLCADNDVIQYFGPHIFHTSDKKIWDYMNEFGEMIPYVNSPIAEYKGKYYNLPINMHTLYQVFRVSTEEEAKKALEAEIVKNPFPSNAEEAALSVVGKTLFEMFFKTYTEKQWKTTCDKVPAKILQRIPVRFTWNNNYFNDVYQGLPKFGYSSLVRNMTLGARIIKKDSEVELLGIYDYLEKARSRYEKICICQALDKAFGYESGAIPYLKTRFTNLGDGCKVPAPVINHCDDSTPATRTTNYGLLSYGTTSVGVYVSEEPLGEDKDSCGNLREEEQVSYNWAKKGETWTKCCYPARDTELYQRYAKFASDKGYILCGRLAENLYLDMHAAVKNALEKAKCYL